MRGRAAEWSAVLDLLAAAHEGRSGVLLVEGEPGIGKSLLLREATRTARARGVLSVTVGAPDLGRMPLAESLLSALGEDVIADGEDRPPSRTGTCGGSRGSAPVSTNEPEPAPCWLASTTFSW
ncbi:ATP-binding protein [Actinomadura sp. NPDC047616]|uniref:ATP-binding protein n=1 Tax=Actinomadura sp. NPDC047616 TaxID=3155914 RepID=UPI0034001B77